MKDETRGIIELIEMLGIKGKAAEATKRAIDLAQKQYDAATEYVEKCVEMAMKEEDALPDVADYVEHTIEALYKNRKSFIAIAMMGNLLKKAQEGTQE